MYLLPRMSNDPFALAEKHDIQVMYHPLGEIYGYYCKIKGIKFIYINENLPEQMQRFVCAHELGHALLHDDTSIHPLTKHTMTSNLKIEREANQYAVDLLIDGSHEEYNVNDKFKLLDFYGIPREMERFIKEV